MRSIGPAVAVVAVVVTAGCTQAGGAPRAEARTPSASASQPCAARTPGGQVDVFVPSSVPSGFSLIGAAHTVPVGACSGFSLTLSATSTGKLVADMTRPTTTSSSGIEVIGSAGPHGLHGVREASGGQERVLLSRDLSTDALRSIARGSAFDALHVVAQERSAIVPGTGTVPVPQDEELFLTAWAHQAGDTQCSLIVGSFGGGVSDLLVLDWWFGKTQGAGASREYVNPAWVQAAGSGDEAVPDALLTVKNVDGDLVLTRSVCLSAAQHHEIESSNRRVAPTTWDTMTTNVRSST